MNDIVKKLRQQARGPVVRSGQMVMREAADEIERLRVERDELRREVCCAETPGETQGAALLYAKMRGWDCFQEKP